MGNLIDRDAMVAAMRKHAKGKTILGGQTYQSLTLETALDAIAALPAVTVGVEPPFCFDRYINGVRMAEDVCVERETTLESAMLVAARIASKGPNGEAPVLVYRAPVTPAPDAAAIREAALREAADYIEHAPVGTRFQDRDAILALITEKPHDRA